MISCSNAAGLFHLAFETFLQDNTTDHFDRFYFLVVLSIFQARLYTITAEQSNLWYWMVKYQDNSVHIGLVITNCMLATQKRRSTEVRLSFLCVFKLLSCKECKEATPIVN